MKFKGMGYWGVLLLVVIADQLSKAWIVERLHLYQSETIIPGFFSLTYVTNTGAAFSFLADIESPWRHYFFLGIGAFALVVLTVMWYRRQESGIFYSVALGLIAGGAIGNLIDRVRVGAVIDFIDISLKSYHWPAFNVADSAICVGVGVFLVVTFKEDGKKVLKERNLR